MRVLFLSVTYSQRMGKDQKFNTVSPNIRMFLLNVNLIIINANNSPIILSMLPLDTRMLPLNNSAVPVNISEINLNISKIPIKTNTHTLNCSTIHYNISTIPFNISTIPFNISNIPFNIRTIPFNISIIPLNIGTIPFNISTLPFNISTIPFNICPDSGLNSNSTDWLKDVALPVVAVAGLFGNCIAIVSITYQNMKSNFHQSQIALSVCDVLFITVVFIDKNVDMAENIGFSELHETRDYYNSCTMIFSFLDRLYSSST
jgi:hypothetical protein